jgi:hypothetical protein|tara:strand:- start:143 stop:1750 length:1608 start_codon:yes stop_codon:yes gene_type:complete
MNNKLKEWGKTKATYLDWLVKNRLRKIFSESIKIENFSLWWITKLVDKDIILHNDWYHHLNSTLNKKKLLIQKRKINFFLLIAKVIKKFILIIIASTSAKFLYKNKSEKNSHKINCFHTTDLHIVPFKKIYLDHQYGKASLKNKEKNCYLIQFGTDLKSILSFLKRRKKLSKIPVNHFILMKYVSLFDILNVYLKTFFLFLKLIFILRKKNYFIINKIDCSFILRPLLIESFFGDIQESLINAKAIKNFFKEEDYKNFINYGEFFPGWRAIYHFAKLGDAPPKIITMNHGIYSENNLFWSLKKNEFNELDNDPFYSPKPDIFLTQGIKYFKVLKKIFPYKKVYPIGSFKYELANYKFNKPIIKKKLNKIKKNFKKKKILAICTALNDEKNIINFLNKCNLSNYLIILCPHPYFIRKSTLEFKDEFKYDFKVLQNYTTREVASAADFVITGYSSIGLEILLKKINVLKVVDGTSPPFDDFNDGIPVVSDYKKLNRFLNKKTNFTKYSSKKIKENYFYKFDNKTHLRFWKVINKINT